MRSHVDVQTLHSYAAGVLDDATRWSVEEHVSRCDACRHVTGAVDVADVDIDGRLEAVWADVAHEIESQARHRVGDRVLVGLGLPDHLARLLAATPSLTVPWLFAVAITLAAAVAVARATHDVGSAAASAPLMFLVIAPLLPVAAVALSFGRVADPAYDIALAAPMSAGRLLLVRVLAVVASTVPLAGLASLALPELSWTVVAWVVPALALASVTLAFSSWLNPTTAASIVGLLWLAGVGSVEAIAVTPLAAFGFTTQVATAIAGAAAAALVAARMHRFETRISQ